VTQLLQPGNVPAWDGDDPAADIASIFSEQTWPVLWKRLDYSYSTTIARDAELPGLGPTDRVLAWVDADGGYLTRWNGTAWVAVPKRTFIRTVASGTTDASGYITQAHGAPFTPRVVQVQSTVAGVSLGACMNTDTITATTVRLRFFNVHSSGPLVSQGHGPIAIISWE
jgi:hypothetical protein